MSNLSTTGPATGRHEPLAGSDLARQTFVVVSAVIAVVASAIGVGAFGGTPIQQAAGGALSEDGTWVAPAGPAFVIWTPIYLGLIVASVWQAARSRATDARQRRMGWWFAVTMLLNGAWILVVQAGLLLLSLAVIVVLLVALVVTWAPLLRSRPSSWVEAVVLDGTVGVYTGWVSVATVANAAALLSQSGWDGFGLSARVWAVIMLIVAAGIGAGVAVLTRGRLSYGSALAWGLAWIAVGRSDGVGLASTAVAVVAALAAVVVLGSALVLRRERARELTAAG